MPEMLGPDDLVLCSGTLRNASLAEKCAAAVAGGFRALTLWPDDVARARADGIALGEIRKRIAGHGLVVADLDPLLRWLPDEAIPPGVSAATEPEFHAIAEAVGARSLNVAQGFGARVDLDRAAEALAGVCDRAREHGLLVTLEYLPWSGIPDAKTALAIAERTRPRERDADDRHLAQLPRRDRRRAAPRPARRAHRQRAAQRRAGDAGREPRGRDAGRAPPARRGRDPARALAAHPRRDRQPGADRRRGVLEGARRAPARRGGTALRRGRARGARRAARQPS